MDTTTEVAVVGGEPENEGMLAIIARAAGDPRVDVQKMQALLDMERQIRKERSEVAFMAAMSRLQTKLPVITKDGVILNKDRSVRSKFARYETIDAVIRPLLAEEGFALSFDSEGVGERIVKFTVKITHREGHAETRSLAVTLDNDSYRTALQNMGSTTSYARRYLVSLLLNIVTADVDDDGQGAANQPITQEQVNEIIHLISATGAQESRFLAYMGVPAISEIRRGDFKQAIAALNSKKKGGG